MEKLLQENMIYNELGNTGMKVSLLSFGGSQLVNNTNEEEAIETVHEALCCGINYIDTAPWYGFGKAEVILGKALRDVPRESYYLATKVGRYLPQKEYMFDFSYKRTLLSVEESLKRIGVDYFDVIQVHDLEFASNPEIIINETLPALQKIKAAGKAKFIGVTGYSLQALQTVLDKSKIHIDTVLSYCRCTPFDQSLLEYLPYFKAKNLGIINAGILGMGLLTNREIPNWHPVIEPIKISCRNAALYCQEIGIDIAKLAAQYAFNVPNIDTHLIGMSKLRDLRNNLTTLNNKPTSDEEDALKEIIDRFFKPLKQTHWENVEVERYRKALKEKS
ncbi:L-galactose dehydrogenase-like [Centruroides sculpturatus]|uniref:L-galactose dehydrogenase-like n=1 Tax=Centruroides sculpturatus TaxID=218467 RepID=UPI000C6E1A0C|nr:L-galactose dehydrogenase-like [Centruroides sculpturatus]XP_023232051.1 L-galactose dehydrogenase-like [Centruroides sculpturatus]XP_023232052.1 L-galactose dehydrogenase-like [Centruroides sculpturatus]